MVEGDQELKLGPTKLEGPMRQPSSLTKQRQEQDSGGVGDMEYISLHGYIRNTPSDTEVHAVYQLSQAGGPDQWKRLYITIQNSAGRRN